MFPIRMESLQQIDGFPQDNFFGLGCYWYVLVGFFFGRNSRRTTLNDSVIDHNFSDGMDENGLIFTLQW